MKFSQSKKNDRWFHREQDTAKYTERVFHHWKVALEPELSYEKDDAKHARYLRLIGAERLSPLDFPDKKFHIAVDEHVYLGPD